MSREDCERLKRSRQPRILESPNPGVGSIDRFVRYGKAPGFELKIHSWDIAATRNGTDWTVCPICGHAIRTWAAFAGIVRIPPAPMK